MASQARIQSWVVAFLHCPTPPPPPQALVFRTHRRSRTCPRTRVCSPGSLLACAALPRPPITTAPDAACTVPSYAQCSVMLSNQPCPHPRRFLTKIGRTRYTGGIRRCRSRHWRKHRPAAGKHGNKGGAWKQQWATGTESAERRGYRAAGPATPGVGGVGTRFLRTGCTVLWRLSHNLVGSEFTIPRPFPCAVHAGTVAAPVAGNIYRQVTKKRELSVKIRYS